MSTFKDLTTHKIQMHEELREKHVSDEMIWTT